MELEELVEGMKGEEEKEEVIISMAILIREEDMVEAMVMEVAWVDIMEELAE